MEDARSRAGRVNGGWRGASRRKTNRLFRLMADCAPVALWISGADAKCFFFNQTWLDFTGRSLEQELGDGWVEGVHHEDLQRCIDTYMAAFNARETFTMEYRLRRKDEVYRWVLDRGAPRFGPTGTFEGYIGSCVDITEIREARAALERSHDDLESLVRQRTRQIENANEELKTFNYSVAHDLRSPLRKISAFGKILKESAGQGLPDPARNSLERILANAETMDGLIDGLLALSDITRKKLTHTEVDLSARVEAIAQELQSALPEREVDFSVAPGLRVRGHPELIETVLRNLLENAWKFTTCKLCAKITFGAAPRGGERVFYVRDNGAGFPMEDHDRLFAPFQRLHPQSLFPGSGIGLATVRRAVRRHGGTIWAEARPGAGASFYFTLGRGEPNAETPTCG